MLKIKSSTGSRKIQSFSRKPLHFCYNMEGIRDRLVKFPGKLDLWRKLLHFLACSPVDPDLIFYR
ncbi:hypothetical protein ASJ81_15395 [Methanosarcina spelaei]|uniref:Uncharacterized protein n=1 Tax=Methanosarcina spelaei TaxID=1036679 RepID=A0A2A2HXP5_9EURY|nr:hypothetical protein ASJ81_15395 [Methanosarcina spelaei]